MATFLLGARLALLHLSIALVNGVYSPFWPLWLAAKHLDAVEIGQILAVAYLVKLVAGPFAGYVADRLGEQKRPAIAFALLALLASLLYIPAEGFFWIAVASVFTFAFYTTLGPLIDSLTLRGTITHRLDYGLVRLWGSLGFVVATALAGLLLVDAPPWTILASFIGGMGVVVVTAFQLPDLRSPRPTRRLPPIGDLLTDRAFLLFLAVTSCNHVSHMVYYGFSALYWQAGGMPGWMIGALWAEGVVAEVIFFAFGRRIMARLTPTQLFLASGAGGMVRWTVLALTTDPVLLAGVQWLHCLTFTATHLGAMYFIHRAVPLELSTRAQGLYNAVSLGVVFAVGLPVAGWLFEVLGGRAFLVTTLISAAGLGMTVLLRRVWRDGAIVASAAP